MPKKHYKDLRISQYYHVYNRGSTHIKMFSHSTDNDKAIERIDFYRLSDRSISFSHYHKLNRHHRAKIQETRFDASSQLVQIIAFVLMPNHFHFLLRQNMENGITRFMRDFTNSYTRYYNIRHHRRGALFQGRFGAVPIKSDLQLLYTSKYIHLNPFSNNITKSSKDTLTYKWSSFKYYGRYVNSNIGTRAGFSKKTNLVDRSVVQTYFNQEREYIEFVFKNADLHKQKKNLKKMLKKEREVGPNLRG